MHWLRQQAETFLPDYRRHILLYTFIKLNAFNAIRERCCLHFCGHKNLLHACSWIYARLCTCGHMVFISLGLNKEVLMFSCVEDEFL